MPKSKKRPVPARALRGSRTRIEMSNLRARLEFNRFERKRLIEKMRHTVERLQSLEREAGKLERRAEASKGRRACRSAQGTERPQAGTCAKSKSPAKSASPN